MKMFLFLLSALGVAVFGAGEARAELCENANASRICVPTACAVGYRTLTQYTCQVPSYSCCEREELSTPCKCGSASGQSFSTAPTSGLCSIGTASSVKFVSGDSSLSGTWEWSCDGDKECGEKISCSAEKGTASSSSGCCCEDSVEKRCASINCGEDCVGAIKHSVVCSKVSSCPQYASSKTSNTSSGPIVPNQLAGLPTNSNLVRGILTNIANFLLGIVGVIALIAFVISGLQYFLVATDEKMLETAKKTMINAIIGLIVALSGYIAVKTIEMLLRG